MATKRPVRSGAAGKRARALADSEPDKAPDSRHTPPYRILSIDGGGIYGLVSATWLQQLCAQNADFLTPGHVKLFAGISAGAVTALLLAKEENPRDGVAKAVSFWSEAGAFTNNNPFSGPLSLMGIGGLTGPYDFLNQLQRYFGDMTLGDLPHTVQISTFNWTGAKDIDFSTPGQNPGAQSIWRALNVVPPALAYPPNEAVPPPEERRSWRPKVFTNWPDDPDRRYRVVDVAYGAASPAGIRAIRGGIADAATYTANPSVEAIAGYIHYLSHPNEWSDASQEETTPGTPPTAGHYLDQVHLLSIGNGSVTSRYWLRNFDMSLRGLGRFPTNPFLGDFFPPTYSVQFDGPIESADYMCRQFLRERYFRLGPGIMPIPVTVASAMSRLWWFRQFFLQQVRYNTQTPPSLQAVDGTLKFLENGWTDPVYTDPGAPTAAAQE